MLDKMSVLWHLHLCILSYPLLTLPFSILWLTTTFLSLSFPYHTILQTISPCISTLHYINCLYFVVVLQFVNCCQLPQSKLLYLHNILWEILSWLFQLLIIMSNLFPLILKLRTQFTCEGATHKLKPSPSVIISDLQHTTLTQLWHYFPFINLATW